MGSTYAPETIKAVRRYLKPITGLDDISLGIVGDENHKGGYHHGWGQRKLNSSGALSDYSWQESSRDWNFKSDASRALDIGFFPRLIEFSVWLVNECARGAPDCADIREIIYTPDGKVVKRWDRLGIRSSGDDSHLSHTHIDWFADSEFKSKMGPFVRFFGGINMMYLQVVNTPEVYVSDGVRTRLIPPGPWPWIQKLQGQYGVPFFADLPDMPMLLALGGPLDKELGSDSGSGGGGGDTVVLPADFQLEIPGFTVTATMVEGQ